MKLTPIIKNSAPSHIVQNASLELNRKTKEIMGAYVERQRRPGEVRAAENDLWKRKPYKTGDGDYTAQVPRAGSMDAYALPSRGNRT